MNIYLQNASWFEVMWTVLGVCALFFNWDNFQDARDDLKAVERSGQNGRYHLVAKQNHRNEFARFLKQLGFVLIGAMFMLTPPPVIEAVSLAGYVGAVVLMLMQTWLVIGAFLDRQDRDKLDEMLAMEVAAAAAEAAGEAAHRHSKEEVG